MLKDNRGFSFVEMMTVCVILCVICIVAYPIVILTINQSKEKMYKENVKSLERLSLSWALENVNSLPDDDKDARFITLKQLAKEEYIKTSDIEDPRDNSMMDGCIKIVKGKNEQYESKYYESSCEEAGKKYVPKVKVLNTVSKKHEVNSETIFQYPKLKATSVLGEKISIPKPTIYCNKKKVKDLENQKVGDQCNIVYKIKDVNNGLVNKKVFTVTIVDSKAPVITVFGQKNGFDEEIGVGDAYQIPAVTVTDNSGETLTVQISTNLNTKQKGSYEIVYSATDSNENLGLFIIRIQVVDNKLLDENQIIVDNASVLPGDGKLEKISTSEYIFKGTNPNNFIRYQNELWRIVSLNQNGIKIIKNDPITMSVWNSKNSTNYKNSELATQLLQYQNSIISNVVNKQARFSIGAIDPTKLIPVKDLERSESSLQSESELRVGTILVSDYLKASANENCLKVGTDCQNQNYLTRSYAYFTSGIVQDEKAVMTIGPSGLEKSNVMGISNIVPVMYLKGYKTLQGTGSMNDPYWYFDEN